MSDSKTLTHFSVTVQFTERDDHFEPEVLAKTPSNAARIALWRLEPEFRLATVALIISAPADPPNHFPAYDGEPLAFVRNPAQRTLSPHAPAAARESRLTEPVNPGEAEGDQRRNLRPSPSRWSEYNSAGLWP